MKFPYYIMLIVSISTVMAIMFGVFLYIMNTLSIRRLGLPGWVEGLRENSWNPRDSCVEFALIRRRRMFIFNIYCLGLILAGMGMTLKKTLEFVSSSPHNGLSLFSLRMSPLYLYIAVTVVAITFLLSGVKTRRALGEYLKTSTQDIEHYADS